MKFSTKDQDNDQNPNKNCAETYKGAWWFRSCYNCHLNGIYGKAKNGIEWLEWKKDSLKFTEMKLVPTEP